MRSQQSCKILSVGLDFRQGTKVLALWNVWHRLLGGNRGERAKDTGFGITHQYKGIANEVKLRATITCLYSRSGGSSIPSLSMQTINNICRDAFVYLASNHALLLLP